MGICWFSARVCARPGTNPRPTHTQRTTQQSAPTLQHTHPAPPDLHPHRRPQTRTQRGSRDRDGGRPRGRHTPGDPDTEGSAPEPTHTQRGSRDREGPAPEPTHTQTQRPRPTPAPPDPHPEREPGLRGAGTREDTHGERAGQREPAAEQTTTGLPARSSNHRGKPASPPASPEEIPHSANTP